MMRLDADVTVVDPRTGRPERLLAAPTSAELTAHTDRLREAQPAWEALGAGGRADALLELREALARHRPAIVTALIADTGRWGESELEADLVLRALERWARSAPGMLAEAAPQPSSMPSVTLRSGLVPYALVGAISPWNFPLLLGTIDLIPALAAGCAVLLKPSEVAPRFLAPLQEAVAEVPAIAPVLGLVEGAAEVGEAMLRLVDAIAFTGSVPTGRRVAQAAAAAFIPAFLELGGKDPAIVLKDADLDRASSALLWGGTANAGQSCLSIERVYVEQAAHDRFVELLVAKAEKLKLAHPDVGDGQLGPLIAPDQVDVVARHLTDAVARGATVRTGGAVERLGGGAYVRPTVLIDVDHTMLVMTEETFGPVLPVMAVRDEDEAVALANDSVYGLSAAVFAGDETQALKVGRRLRAGAVSINDAALTAIVQEGEKQAFGLSGLGGSRMGPAALRRFLRTQAFLVSDGKGRDPWWYQGV